MIYPLFVLAILIDAMLMNYVVQQSAIKGAARQESYKVAKQPSIPVESCVNGVAYLSYPTGTTVKYTLEGKVATCSQQ